ncbi:MULTISPECIES: EF-hand domain-containing protein [unclassified Sphingopyxis]|uniref:EF-hand domain-containing protein n=1 Tax=unclassified Sphingopyxis TaxID=2614943 RepID=UPI000ADC33BC|nr:MULTISPECIES: hypothetical protein [unclassified Sphingopyxis]
MGTRHGVAIVATMLAIPQSVASQPPAPDIPLAIVGEFRSRGHIEDYLARVVGELRQADRGDDGLDQGDVDFAVARRVAVTRAGQIQRILPMDLDGDLRITRAEIGESIGADSDPEIDEATRDRRIEHRLSPLDIDGDGAITLPEAAATARQQAWEQRFAALLALDPDRNGRLTASEMRLLAEKAFHTVDADGDGTTSETELKAIEPLVRENRMTWQAEICSLPPVPAGAMLIAFGGYESRTISPVQIPSNDPREKTRLVEVAIEPGEQPLYLVLTSYETTLWRLSGATARVSHVVATSYRAGRGGISAVGVTGVPERKISIARAGCPNYFSSTTEEEALRTRASIRFSLKRDPDAMFADYSTDRVSLPSGAIAADPDD